MYIYLGTTEIVFMSIYLNEKNRKNIMRIPSWVTQVPEGGGFVHDYIMIITN